MFLIHERVKKESLSPGPDEYGNPAELLCTAVDTKRATNGMLLFEPKCVINEFVIPQFVIRN